MRRASGELAPAGVPLGATLTAEGVVFSVWSAYATQLTLSTFDGEGVETVYAMRPLGDGTHALFVRGASDGLRYGYRAHGPWAPEAGHRFNPSKLLLDPYARRIVGSYDPRGPIVDHVPGDRNRACTEDSAPYVPRSVVARPLTPLPLPERRHALEDSVVYEAHVARMTELCTSVPLEQRGRFAALRAPAVIAHLQRLGVTALELMPVQARMSEPRLLAMGLSNQWGYSPVGFVALEESYATLGDDPRVALRETCLALREAGIDVWLDVVFNHTAELDLDGPTFHLRGLDHKSYYRVGDDGRPIDTTGCGNTLRAEHPRVVSLICDSLRELVLGCGVAGFRFDLGAALGRHGDGPLGPAMRTSPLFLAMDRDPVLSKVRRIVEPWDTQGYALGSFSARTVEWNDRYRDGVRRFFLGDPRVRGDFATRIAGSSDVFEPARGPRTGINYVTCHDGFTLADLVSYDRKHNEANGENNRDGHDPSFEESFGVEGPTHDPSILARRLAKQKALLLTLLLSAGIPMLNMGDELGRTQHGNNNAYCQAFPLRWPDDADPPSSLLTFVQKLVALRAAIPELRRTTFFEAHELSWLERDGQPADWSRAETTLAASIATTGGELWLSWNGGTEPVEFRPPRRYPTAVTVLRSDEHMAPSEDVRERIVLAGRSAAAVRFGG